MRVVVGSYDTRLYCFDPASGEKLWAYETDNYVNGTPAILGDRIVFGGCDAALHVVSAESGEAYERLQLGSDCYVAGSVALADGKAYFGHYGNRFVCVDLASGRELWGVDGDQAFFASPALDEEHVVVGGRDKLLRCLRRSDGSELWSFKTRRQIDSSAVICGDKVVFGSADGRLFVLRLSDGREEWSYDVGRPIYTSPAVTNGHVLVGANDGNLYAFGPAPTATETED
jgi:outer membrane protein assembly factor BamB